MYGVCPSGISIDRVAQDKGMLGLCNLVNGQLIVEVENTDWSQWRYVVKLWFSELGTSIIRLGQVHNSRSRRGHTGVHHQKGVEPDILMKNAGVEGWLPPSL